MIELIIKRITTIKGAYVICTKCNGKFFKVPTHFTDGKQYNYCPLCGSKIDQERFKEN